MFDFLSALWTRIRQQRELEGKGSYEQDLPAGCPIVLQIHEVSPYAPFTMWARAGIAPDPERVTLIKTVCSTCLHLQTCPGGYKWLRRVDEARKLAGV